MEHTRINRSARAERLITWSVLLAFVLAANASDVAEAYAREQQGSANDYLNDDSNNSGADEFALLGVTLTNGEGTLWSGQRFDGAEIVKVIPDGPGASAGLKGEQVHKLVTLGVVVTWLLFPPAIIAAAALGLDEIAESREFIVAVDGVRIRDITDFECALNHAEPGDIMYLTIVRGGHRKQIQIILPDHSQEPKSSH